MDAERAVLATTRAFGRQPYQDVLAAAAAEAGRRRAAGCGLSDNGLATLMLSIVFTEAGPLASATSAPSPMTLSRWDSSASLYSFKSRTTAYRDAFWHPGIGLWQFDHPWDNTAAERIDTQSAAALAAQVMAFRYCSWSPSTGYSRFAWTVRPWHGCDATGAPGQRCEVIFNEHYTSSGALRGFTLVDGVGRLGGASWRSCQLVGHAGAGPCLYVDPAAAQGYRGWAQPSFSTNPISSPFYVTAVNGRERRDWLGLDSGYAIDIVATTVVGSDPRTTIAWSSGRRLCDVTARRGACELKPPPWKRWRYDQVTGTYEPFVADFDGNGRSDILWYAAGAADDYLWLYRRDGSGRVVQPKTVVGAYEPIVGDFDGNGRDDILWYRPGAGADSIWFATSGGEFRTSAVSVGGDYEPLVGDFDGNGLEDVYWHGGGDPGSPDRLWLSQSTGGFLVSARSMSAGYQPFVGDFNADRLSDIFWYGPGATADGIWWGRAGGAFESTAVAVGGTYEPLVGDFDGNARDDVFWYGRGALADGLWLGMPGASPFEPRSASVGGTYEPSVGDLSGDGRDDILWYAPGSAADGVWLGTGTGAFVADGDVIANNRYAPLIGGFDAAAGADVFWYAPGTSTDGFWYD
jgi:hypothetical protein